MKFNHRHFSCLLMIGILLAITSGCANSPSSSNAGHWESNKASLGDYPAMIMVDDTLYYLEYQAVDSVKSSSIIGYTSSYTDSEPSKDGETNFSRTLGLPYARTEDGIAVKYNGQWNLFVQQNDNQSYKNGSSSMNDNQYAWEKKVFVGDFVIALNDDYTYQCYGGGIHSCYDSIGTWTNEDGIIVMTESSSYDNVFRFKLTEEGLIYIADGSSKFMYVDVADGDRFLLRNGIIWDEQKYTPDYDSTSTHHADVFLEKLKKDGYHRGDEIDKDYHTENITGIFNITPQAIMEENPDLELFYVKDGYHCFMMYKGEIYRYDTFGGYHHRLVLWDYDGNGVKDLVSYCSYGSGVSYLSVGITDLTTMKAQQVITRGVLWEPGFTFDYDGESIFIDGEKVEYVNGEFHCGTIF